MKPINSIYPIPLRTFSILSSLLRLGLLPSSLLVKHLYPFFFCPSTYYLTHQSRPSWFDQPNIILWGVQIMTFLIVQLSSSAGYFLSLKSRCLSWHPYSRAPYSQIVSLTWEKNIHYINQRMPSIKYNKNTSQNTIHCNYQTPTCFGTAGSSSGSLLEQRNLCIGLVLLCSTRLPEDGTPVPKHVGVW
jgi:hypothetical protein